MMIISITRCDEAILLPPTFIMSTLGTESMLLFADFVGDVSLSAVANEISTNSTSIFGGKLQHTLGRCATGMIGNAWMYMEL